MKSGHIKSVCAIIAILTLTASISILPNTKALNFSYTDNASFNLSISSSLSTVKAGDTPVFTITLTLNTYLVGNAHVRIWANTSSSATVDLVNENLMESLNWSSGTSFNKPYSISIPSSLLNNNYIYATIDVGTKHFSNIILAIVQNPTYSALQSQITQLQSDIIDLNNELNQAKADYANAQNQVQNLQNNLANLQGNNTSLQTQISNLSSEKASLQTQLANLQAQLDLLTANNTDIQTQLEALVANNTALKSEIDNLETEKLILLNQTNTLQARINQLQLNNTNLQQLVNNFYEQISTLQTDLSKAQENNNNVTILMYIALVVAIVFIATTFYIVFLVMRKKRAEKPKEAAEAELY